MIIVRAFALPLARALAKLWTWFYTAAAPRDEQENRRAEVLSDLHEHIADFRAEGYRPDEIALHVICRVVWGMKDDVAWFVPYLPSTLAERFQSGSEFLGRIGTPRSLTTALAVFGMMNMAHFMSDGDKTWIVWVLTNGIILAVTIVNLNQERQWARRIARLYLYVASSAVVCLLLWVTFEFRLYEVHTLGEYTVQPVIAMVPVILMLVVSSETCRVRAFSGRWWPVFALWIIIGAISLTTAIHAGLTITLMTWAIMASLAAGFIVLCGIFAAGSAVVCFAVLKGSAKCMGLMAVGLRRLESSQ